jgi:hypothetical protein
MSYEFNTNCNCKQMLEKLVSFRFRENLFFFCSFKIHSVDEQKGIKRAAGAYIQFIYTIYTIDCRCEHVNKYARIR